MADASPGPRPRPISPAVTIWRWHITMAASILHRATGVGLYLGALVMMVWALALASGPDAYGLFTGLAGSIVGKLGFFVLTLCVFYHLANGVRHLVWDAGFGFKPQTASGSAWTVITIAIAGTLAFWGLLAMTGAL
jgi:succinate dehydrogenase / fumarate reductase cytochrome b subunit